MRNLWRAGELRPRWQRWRVARRPDAHRIARVTPALRRQARTERLDPGARLDRDGVEGHAALRQHIGRGEHVVQRVGAVRLFEDALRRLEDRALGWRRTDEERLARDRGRL